MNSSDGRPKRARKSDKAVGEPSGQARSQHAETPEPEVRPSTVHPDDLSELEALASAPNSADLSAMADKLSGRGQTGSRSQHAETPETPDTPQPAYRMDKKLIKESLSIAYSFVLTVAERGSKGAIPGNKMNDLIARKPGYQARLDNLLMAIAEEYGVDKVVPAPIALLLFTATVYGECSNTPSSQSSTV